MQLHVLTIQAQQASSYQNAYLKWVTIAYTAFQFYMYNNIANNRESDAKLKRTTSVSFYNRTKSHQSALIHNHTNAVSDAT